MFCKTQRCLQRLYRVEKKKKKAFSFYVMYSDPISGSVQGLLEWDDGQCDLVFDLVISNPACSRGLEKDGLWDPFQIK